jgi:hypothetical protein
VGFEPLLQARYVKVIMALSNVQAKKRKIPMLKSFLEERSMH